MSTVRIRAGATEPVEALAVDSLRGRLTGLSNLKVYVRRMSDGKHFDWSDNTFKTSPVQLLESLIEVDAILSPGAYHLDTPSHPGGFDTEAVTNPVADDTYRVTAIQDGAPQSAVNFPQEGEIKIGQWVEELFADLSRKPEYIVLQTYSYNEDADRLDCIVWVEFGNLVVAAPLSCTVQWYDRDGVLQWTKVDSAPDAQGFFKVEQSAPGLVADQLYYAVASVEIAGVGTVSGGKGSFTF